ncbi:uncharacterized protein LOC131658381 [Vicia villosa]|uniref:uncharacterized protein LOC131658381 n=1 Tax=Vicia villosa TaxID=3911 RepID=UPI00273CE648|nr:uncharacterized protein LOC131658381 [Vicia villosa]
MSGKGRGRPKKASLPPTNHGKTSSPAEPGTRSNNSGTKAQSDTEKKVTQASSSQIQNNTPTAAEAKGSGEPLSPKKLWVDVISGNRNPTNGLQMEFVAPKVVNGEIEVEIEEDDIASEIRYWDTALIMYVLGGDLSMNTVKQFMIRNWNFAKLPDMFFNDEGYFILRFPSMDDKDLVLTKGPYTIHNMPMLLTDWKPNFDLKKDMLRTIPIWVTLPHLPLHLWGQRSLSKIGSALGTPLVTDECTANKLRVSYARILVEMDITKPPITEISIRDAEGNKRKQIVEYDWRPNYCDKCQRIGHNCLDPIVKKPVKQWKAKPIQAAVVEGKITEVTPPVVLQSTDNVEEAWTTIERQRKGKAILSEEVVQIRQDNSFDPLTLVTEGPDILVLVETRVKRNNACGIRNKLRVHDSYVDNYDNHYNGRIWLSWDSRKYDIKKVRTTDQLLHCGVYDSSGVFVYWLTAIYALNHLDKRKLLWCDIAGIHVNQTGPWCLIGDFNNVIKAQDRVGGRLVSVAEIRDLKEMMDNTGLAKLDSVGEYYTWSNKHVDGIIYSRIDHLLGNIDWLTAYQDWILAVHEPQVSDHGLLCLSRQDHVRRKNLQFKFRNNVIHLKGFHQIVLQSWQQQSSGNPMYILWYKLLGVN